MKRQMIYGAMVPVLAVLVLLAGCTRKENAAASSESGTSKISGELNVLWLAGMNQTSVIKDMVSTDFIKLFPDLRVNMDESPNNEISQKALLEATAGTGAYDVVMQAGTLPQLANIDALYPLDDFIKRDNFDISKMVDNGISYKGHYYGIPVRYDAFLFHYNEEQFRAAGLDPDKPPADWDEFEQYGIRLTGNGKFGVSRGYGNNILAEAFVNTVYSLGGDICDADNNPVFNNEIGVQALTILMRELKDAKIVNPAATGWNYSEEIAGYLSGEAAMFIHYPARYIDANFKPDRSNIIGKSRVAPMFGKNVLTKGSYALIFKSSTQKDAAWEFLKWLADAEVQKKVILAGGDCNPTNIDTLNDPELQARYASLGAISGQFDKAKTWPQITQTEAISASMNKYMNMTAVGTMGIKEALDAAVREARQFLIDSGELKP
ncbi:MAG: extracellular solute-binding protein [Treponema sp.]|jgi:multiple sugar transport system substrate-binding protein|nr:extracellular solute-binding protein [Treponema sp.]